MVPGWHSLVIAYLTACTSAHPATTDSEPAIVETQPAIVAAAPTASGDHALKQWMEAELLYRVRMKDFAGLVHALDALASVAPREYPHWTEAATASAQAARDGDLERVRRGCAACHHEYRVRYRSAPLDYDIERLVERSRR